VNKWSKRTKYPNSKIGVLWIWEHCIEKQCTRKEKKKKGNGTDAVSGYSFDGLHWICAATRPGLHPTNDRSPVRCALGLSSLAAQFYSHLAQPSSVEPSSPTHTSFSLLAKIKCCICSYHFNIWYMWALYNATQLIPHSALAGSVKGSELSCTSVVELINFQWSHTRWFRFSEHSADS
jgi:hypothetical protein